jgi:hypothetical protein
MYIRYLHYLCLTQFKDVYTIYTRPPSVQARYSRLALVTSSLHYDDSVDGNDGCLAIAVIPTGNVSSREI